MAKRHFPVRPNLEQLKHQAKDLLRAFRRGDAEAIEDFREYLLRWFESEPVRLADAHAIETGRIKGAKPDQRDQVR